MEPSRLPHKDFRVWTFLVCTRHNTKAAGRLLSMGDAMSIITSCICGVTACVQSAKIISKLIPSVKNVDEHIRDFYREMQNLASITEGVRFQL